MPKNRGQYCRDIHLSSYLVKTTGPMPLVWDLRIDHDRFGTSGVQFPENDRGKFHFRRVVLSSHLKSRVDNILSKVTAYELRLI